MTLAALYLRVSTQEQNDSGLSLEHQRTQCEHYARVRLDCDDVVPFREVASATRIPSRKILCDMMEGIACFSHLVVLRLDRLARNTLDLLRIARTLHTKHVPLHSVTEAIDTQGPAGQLFFTVLAALAEFEVNLIAQRTRDALSAKRARGEWVGRLPYGFADRDLSLDPEQMETVREAYRLRQVGMGYHAIAKVLCLPPSTIRHILNNPIYSQHRLL
jgi:site-specific DNA recombinase